MCRATVGLFRLLPRTTSTIVHYELVRPPTTSLACDNSFHEHVIRMPGTGESVTAADGEVSRSSGAEQRLRELAIQLPLPLAPIGIYSEPVQTGSLLFLNGVLPVAHNERLGENWKTRRAFWANRAAYETTLRASFLSLARTHTRHAGDDRSVDRYDPALWVDELAFLSKPGQADIQTDLFYDCWRTLPEGCGPDPRPRRAAFRARHEAG